MNDPSWTDQMIAWSSLATTILTGLLVAGAWLAWRTAKATLTANRLAADAARQANEQARRDSIEQTRPYIYAQICPGLASTRSWDLRISNTGRSTAKALTLEFSDWPQDLDDVSTEVRKLFDTPRSLPPKCNIRTIWRLEGNFTDGTTEAGLPRLGTITVRYASDDPSAPRYDENFDVQIDDAGLWPAGEEGPTPNGLKGPQLEFYRLGQVLVRRVAELTR